MASASQVSSQAFQLAEKATSADVRQLAKMIRDLADECQRIERKTDAAQADANRAKRR